jgi:hypothetical protein
MPHGRGQPAQTQKLFARTLFTVETGKEFVIGPSLRRDFFTGNLSLDTPPCLH